MRYKLRSSTASKTTGPVSSPDDISASNVASSSKDASGPPPEKKARMVCRRKVVHKQIAKDDKDKEVGPVLPAFGTNIMSLGVDLVLHLAQYLDVRSLLSLYRTCHYFYDMLRHSSTFWRYVCIKDELANYDCLNNSDDDELLGWSGKPMRVRPPEDYEHWRKIYLRGLQMRKNIVKSNFQGWRIYANSRVPVAKLTPDLDLNEIKKQMGEFDKLSVNDDIKIDWDDKQLVVFHFFRYEGESCTIRVWDIENEPRFVYAVEKGIEYITDKVFVHDGHVVIVPSWPLQAGAVVMTLGIENEMKAVGKFLFCEQETQEAIDENWEHTQLRVVRDKAMVVCRCPKWMCLVVDLPDCNLLCNISLESVGSLFECQQIRSYKTTAMVLFAHKSQETSNTLVTVDVTPTKTKLRSVYTCKDVVDVALFTDPEEIYLMKRNGDVVLYDANLKTEVTKIANPNSPAANYNLSEYQLFVNRKEQICVMQSASEVPGGRRIKVYTYGQHELYTINLDLCKYGMSRDESICIYTNGAFLAAADSKKFALFNVKTGNHVGCIQIPAHLERAKGKDEKYCMFEQTGLSLFIFDEDKLIAVHDYERSFPAVLDIYKFW